MTDEHELKVLLRSAMPPIDPRRPSRDLWPAVVQRSRARRNWSWVDAGVAAATFAALWMRPDVAALLAYHF